METTRKAPSKFHFNKRSIGDVATPEGRAELHRDSATKGLGIKVEPTGSRVYFWHRKTNDKHCWWTIGDATATTLEKARSLADERNAQLADWKRRGFVGEAPWSIPDAPTLNEVVNAYRDRHIAQNAKNPERTKKITIRSARRLGNS